MLLLSQKRSSYLYLFMVFTLAVTIKYFLDNSSVKTLDFLIGPPARIVATFFSPNWYWDAEQGYVFPELGIYINKGCAAITFLTILFLSLSTFIILSTSGKLRIKSLLLVLFLCYPLCISVNSIRILTSIYVNHFTDFLTPPFRQAVHEFTGGLCFFSALLLFVLLAKNLLQKLTPHTNSFTNTPSSLSL